jgi:hypothetical protein
MATVDVKPAAPAAEERRWRHRLTAVEGVAVSLDAPLSVAYGPGAAALPARRLGAGS